MSDKIINTFQQRREILSRLSALAETRSEAEMLQAVRSIVRDFAEDLLIAPYLKLLDTSNSQLRGALAHLATLLSPDEIVPALRTTVANRNNSTQIRLNAVTILERFLGQEVSAALLSDLENTDEIAFQSLCEAVEEGNRDRHIFLEYVLQMKEESTDVAYIVLEQLQRLPAIDQLEMLRLIAQEDREPVAEAALNQLERLSPTDAGERLAQVLHTLRFTLPPARSQQAERAARKLRFSGTSYSPPPPDHWRALIASAEASGNQTIWFFRMPVQDEDECPFVSIIVNVNAGILQTYGADQMAAEDFPGRKEIGEMMTVALDGGDSILFLEAPFDYARWLVQIALPPHWTDDAWQPLFGEYSLYNDLIWQFDAPQLDPALHQFYPDKIMSDEELKRHDASATAVDLDELDEMTISLLEHPSMAGWLLHSHLVWNTIRNSFSADDANSLDEFTNLVVREILQWPEHDLFLQGIASGLQAQAAWLHLAGMAQAASQAHLLAERFRLNLTGQNPFLFRYIRKAIEGSR